MRGTGDSAGEAIELRVILRLLIFNPTDQPHLERGLTHHLENAEALLAKGDDVAAVVRLGLALQDLGAASDLGHLPVLGIPAHDAEAAVSLEHRAQHHAIAGLKDVQGQYLLRKQHHIRQWEQGKLAHGQLGHVEVAAAAKTRILSREPVGSRQGAGQQKARLRAGFIVAAGDQSLTSISTPLGRSSFMSASIVLAEGL